MRVFSIVRAKHTLVTNPIFYANDKPHIGHLYTAVISDTISKHNRLRGKKTFLSIGTDEHGLKIMQSAAKKNVDVQDYCKEISQKFKRLFDKAGISHSDFIRTTEKRHEVAVKHLWKLLVERGYIYKGFYEGWFIAKETGSAVEWTQEENYKFKLSDFRLKLLEWLDKNPNLIIPKSRENEVLAILSKPLEDLSISRLATNVNWGILVPNDKNHTIYVWLDALTNYLTVTGYPWIESDELKAFWPPDVHIIGKDILKFHAIYWPSFLLAAGLPLPKKIIAHAHWLKDKKKMSKSIGNVVDPEELIEKYGKEVVKFYLLRDGGIFDDSEFSNESLLFAYTHELKNQYGNLILRSTAKSINKNLTYPSFEAGVLDVEDYKCLEQKLTELPISFNNKFNKGDFSGGLREIFDVISEANIFWQKSEPWKLKKNLLDAEQQKLNLKKFDQVLFWTYESLRISSILLYPIMPEKISMVLKKFKSLDCLNLEDIEEGEFKFADIIKIDYEREKGLLEDSGDLILFPKVIADDAG
ncbi:methionyl-tRNA synthetase [Clydaea vesicula]|uniref:methionine--tRNA ligase n=1 Tax=Clydaea vesicula TaxID=447962 RepID=A0AAD5U5B9_9FUNG|nr:methionyl-tRNA synthetase [Clydaea vesicula]